MKLSLIVNIKIKMEPFNSLTIKYQTQNSEDNETEVKLYNYTDRSIALQSSDHFGKSFTDELIKINGKYNPKLKIGSGWVFSNKKESTIIELLEKINNKELKGVEPKVYGATKKEPSEVTAFINIFKLINIVKSDVEVYVNNGQTFIWGKQAKVEETVKTLNKNIFAEFKMSDTYMVLCL